MISGDSFSASPAGEAKDTSSAITGSHPPVPSIVMLLKLSVIGGAELSMITIARGLKKAGFPITMAVYGSRTEFAHQAAPDINVVELKATKSLSAALELVKYIRQEKPHILISALRHTNIAALYAAKIAGNGTRAIVTVHTPVSMHPLGGNHLKHRLAHRLIGLHYPFADAIVTVSQGIAQDIKAILQRHEERVRVIHNPVLPQKEPSLLPPHPWLSPQEPPVIIGIGRLSWEKDFELLVRAFALALTSLPMRLIILGEGEKREKIEELALSLGVAEHVLLPGFVNNVADWLAPAALFVSPSQFEGFGNAIVEAMNARLPVICTNSPVGPREILEDGRFGLLVPVADADAMAQAIIKTLQNPPDLDAAYARAQEFSTQRCIEQYSALIRQLAG